MIGDFMQDAFYGLKIIESEWMTKTITDETERSKKRRAKKPWAKKKYGSVDVPDTETIYQTPLGIICHPVMAAQIRKEFRSR